MGGKFEDAAGATEEASVGRKLMGSSPAHCQRIVGPWFPPVRSRSYVARSQIREFLTITESNQQRELGYATGPLDNVPNLQIKKTNTSNTCRSCFNRIRRNASQRVYEISLPLNLYRISQSSNQRYYHILYQTGFVSIGYVQNKVSIAFNSSFYLLSTMFHPPRRTCTPSRARH